MNEAGLGCEMNRQSTSRAVLKTITELTFFCLPSQQVSQLSSVAAPSPSLLYLELSSLSPPNKQFSMQFFSMKTLKKLM